MSFIRMYDEAVYDFADFHLPDNKGLWKRIPKVMASPDRAFSRWVQLHPTMPDGSKRERDDVTLPMVSISQVGDPELDWSRYSMFKNKVAFTSDFNGIYVAPHSDPYTLRYQVDLWTKRRRHMNALIEQWLLAFNGDIAVLRVPLYEEGSEYRKLGPEVPTMICEMFHEGIADTSDLEPGEDKNRLLRKTLTVRLNAWLIKGVTLEKTVRQVQASYIDASTGAELEKDTFDEDHLPALEAL